MVTVDDELCLGCESCVEVCPADAIKIMDYSGKAEANENCVECESCVAVCPVKAISL